MKVRELIAALQAEDPELNVELSRAVAIDRPKDEAWEARLDFPIIGLATKDDDLLLVVDHDETLRMFGKLKRFEPE